MFICFSHSVQQQHCLQERSQHVGLTYYNESATLIIHFHGQSMDLDPRECILTVPPVLTTFHNIKIIWILVGSFSLQSLEVFWPAALVCYKYDKATFTLCIYTQCLTELWTLWSFHIICTVNMFNNETTDDLAWINYKITRTFPCFLEKNLSD